MFYLLNKSYTRFQKKEAILFWSGLIIGLVALVFISLNYYLDITKAVPKRGGSYIEGLVGQPVYINPLISYSNGTDEDLIRLTFSNLDELTDHYEVSHSNKIWTAFLKKDLKWSDGEVLKADDVIFTLNTIQNPQNSHPLFSSWEGVFAEKINDTEIRFTLKNPYAFLNDNFKNLYPAPLHIFNDIPYPNLKLSKYNLEPIGSGPYKYSSYIAKNTGYIDNLYLESNPNYYGGTPYFTKFIVNFYKTEDALIKNFNQKEVSGFNLSDPKKLGELKLSYKKISLALPRYFAVFLNEKNNPALKNLEVKKALAMAINKDEIINKIYLNEAAKIDGPLPPQIPGYIKNEDDLFDSTLARSILQKALKFNPLNSSKNSTGLTKNNKSATIEPKDSYLLEITLTVPNTPNLKEVGQYIANSWEKVGVKTNLVVLDLENINDTILKKRSYEALLFGEQLKNNQDLYSFWHSSESSYPGGNLANVSSQTIDNLLESIRQDLNVESRRQKIKSLEKTIRSTYSTIFLVSPNYLYITQTKLEGFNDFYIQSPSNRFNNVNQWYSEINREFN